MADAVNASKAAAVQDVAQLEQMLSEPTGGVIETMRRLEGDVIILGVGGKMGPTLARMAKRASEAAGVDRRIIGVSRFSSSDAQSQLEMHGIETIKCDLLNRDQLNRLPDVPNVIYMAGMKFGSTGKESLTWAMNAFLPGLVSEKFRNSRIAAFSTGNIYGLKPVTHGGSVEADGPEPVGEYAMSCLGRERIFEHFSRQLEIPMSIIRLNYATELRYGVLVDLAQQIRAGEPIDLAMGNFNVIWQADANAMTLQSLEHAASPPFLLNVTGPELLSTRSVCEQLAERMGTMVQFEGEEAADALLNNGQLGHRLFGYPHVSIHELIEWTADWVSRGGASLDKPTHFEARNGRF